MQVLHIDLSTTHLYEAVQAEGWQSKHSIVARHSKKLQAIDAEVYLSDTHKLHSKIPSNRDVVGSWCCLAILLLCQDCHSCTGIGRFPEATKTAVGVLSEEHSKSMPVSIGASLAA